MLRNAFRIFQGTAGEKEAGKNFEEEGSRAPCHADTVRESGTKRVIEDFRYKQEARTKQNEKSREIYS